jgi:phosphotransferase system  glucose/maltose/N-acetylglucosamine-specific IIC component
MAHLGKITEALITAALITAALITEAFEFPVLLLTVPGFRA